MPSRIDIVTFHDEPDPEGRSPWVPGVGPGAPLPMAEPDPVWADWFEELADRIRTALGWRALNIEHIGSTSVPGLPAKPIIDIDLTVADPDDEPSYVPALEAAGFELRAREPWWFGHRCLGNASPRAFVHVFGYDSPELVKHRIFREWLRGNSAERELYASAKRQAAEQAMAAGEDSLQYNERKERVVREIYLRAFRAMGLLDE